MAEPAPGPRELDELTLRRAQRGEDAACTALVERYQRAVFALLGRMVGTRRAAVVEDLAQDAFLDVFRALPGFRPDGGARLSTWILTIATRRAIDELRRPRRDGDDAALAGLADARAARGDAAVHRAELGRAIERAIAALSPDHRAAFLLREYHGLDYAEIAAALAVDVGTVKSRLSRARAALRAALAEVAP